MEFGGVVDHLLAMTLLEIQNLPGLLGFDLALVGGAPARLLAGLFASASIGLGLNFYPRAPALMLAMILFLQGGPSC